MHHHLIKVISEKVQLNEEDCSLLEEYFEPIVYPKNKIIEEAGKVPKYLYYVVSGFLRLFQYNEQGDEITNHLNCPSGFMCAFHPFLHQTISEEYIESITTSEVLRISKSNMDLMISKSRALKDFNISVLQESILYNETRSSKLATMTATERYQDLMATKPEVIHHVPMQYIASFLGMKPESLSRIRKKMTT